MNRYLNIPRMVKKKVCYVQILGKVLQNRIVFPMLHCKICFVSYCITFHILSIFSFLHFNFAIFVKCPYFIVLFSCWPMVRALAKLPIHGSLYRLVSASIEVTEGTRYACRHRLSFHSCEQLHLFSCMFNQRIPEWGYALCNCSNLFYYRAAKEPPSLLLLLGAKLTHVCILH